MSARLGIAVEPSSSIEDAIRDADVVACATSALDPIIGHNHVRKGVHYSSIKPAEIAPEAINACDRAVVHLRDNAPLVVRTHGVVLAEDRKGAHAPSGKVDESAMAELTELLTGTAKGRETAEETTCFLNYSGIGYQFTLVGGIAFEKARAAGLGRELPTEWFTQLEHP
jgi:ornithine cyclodeaminase/alanine dehydrogenase-like protein (mu-crystallin family)